MKFVINLQHVFGFLQVLRFPPPIKTCRHDRTEILLKVTLNTITLTPKNHKGKKTSNSRKDKQCNGQTNKNKKIKNCQQNTKQKTEEPH